GLHGRDATFVNDGAAYHVPPVETRSWFHTGIYFDEHGSHADDYLDLTERFRQEFYQGDDQAVPLAEHEVETGDAPHEAYRALRGALLRTEVYARDGGAKAAHPYQVSENRFRIAQIQPRDGNPHGVYFSHSLETLSYHYERNPSDPRISHALTLEVDGFGNTLRSLAIGYGRRQPDPALPTQADRDKQTQTLITYLSSRYTNAIDDPPREPDQYRTPAPCESRTYELTGFAPAAGAGRFTFQEWIANDFERIDGAQSIDYEAVANAAAPQKRLIEHVRTRYRANDLSDLLPLGTLESLALTGESYKLAFTPGLLDRVFGDRVTAPMLAGEGGYVHSEGEAGWWIPSGRAFYSHRATDTPAEELAFARQHFFLPHRSRDPFGNSAFLGYDAYGLLATQAIDALGNRTLTEHDYRLLQPFRLTDANGNRSEVVFDTLGLVAGTAVMGKPGELKGDSLAGFEADLTAEQTDAFLADPLANAAPLLGHATTRIVYDVHRYLRTGQPAFAATLARETHASDPEPESGLNVQVALSYSDGFGREIQKKIQAEPGPVVEGGSAVDPRWVGSGWTIFNNKGKPVKQFESFFDDTHVFRSGRQEGVSATVFYDPTGRVVATLHPDHTWEKAVFDPWRQETWDANDTTLIDDPAADADFGGFFRRLAASDYLPTWHGERRSGARGPIEQAAAEKAAVHAATPTVTHADALGRAFLSVAHNRHPRDDAPIDEHYAARVIFDIEDNRREVVDANGRVVMRYDYDLLGRQVRQLSMEAGERRILADAAGKPLYAWDSRGHRFRTTYDPLRRPLEVLLRAADGSEQVIGQTVYGEARANPEALNLRGRVFRHRDQAGVVASEAYDFKGNLLVSQRQLAREYKRTLDWSANPELDPQAFASRTTFDALNRPTSVTAPDGSVYRPRFNAANLLERVDVHLRGAAAPTAFVTNVDYDAKGQRTLIEFGNGVRTGYTYDPVTFRLTRLQTLRGGENLQDLAYVYDPVGNITHIHDDAQQTIYFDNQVVAPHADYAYDALYRLLSAEGREHVGQASQPATSWDDAFRARLPHPHDGRAMRRYTERYQY
ncbi:MAG: toxin TcdB middle/C-terminal domain-containing protein, partial [Rhodocyclaceae bacterium]